LLGLVHPAH